MRVLDGCIKPAMKMIMLSSGAQHEVLETGFMKIKMIPSQKVSAGEVGYVVAGIKDIHDIKIGDTITEAARPTTKPHPGYKEIKPFVFAGLYPVNTSDYDNLKNAIEKFEALRFIAFLLAGDVRRARVRFQVRLPGFSAPGDSQRSGSRENSG